MLRSVQMPKADTETTPQPLTNREAEELSNWLLEHCGRQDPKTIAVRKAVDGKDHRAALNIARGRNVT